MIGYIIVLVASFIVIAAIFAALLAGVGTVVFTAVAWVLVKAGLFTAPNWYLIASAGTFAGAVVGAIGAVIFIIMLAK
ncbi:MAG: hypothetical protein HYT12_02570 [Candidatus Liptonbacteria bacterium]|nr:hypothetical protein [Candidatus Liptonbacteria bacterium]